MSVALLLDEKTEEQAWSKIYAYQVNVGAGGVVGPGADSITKAVLTTGSFAFGAGSDGTITSGMLTSVLHKSTDAATGLKHRQLSLSAQWTSCTMSPQTNSRQFLVDITIPGGELISYPVYAAFQQMPGACSAAVFTPDPTFAPLCAQAQMISTSVVRIQCMYAGSALTTPTIAIQATLNFVVA